MSDVTVFALRVAIVGFFATVATTLITGKNAPAWLRYTEVSVMFGSMALALLVVVVEVIRTRAYKQTVREVPASNGIQVFGTFLDESEDTR